jgi:hypothetical protein
MATALELREIALSFPGTTEEPSYGTPAFKVRKKLFVRLRDDYETIALKMPFADRDERIAMEPDIFYITEHYRTWPGVLVRLEAIDRARLAELIERAWLFTAPRRLLAAWESGDSAV